MGKIWPGVDSLLSREVDEALVRNSLLDEGHRGSQLLTSPQSIKGLAFTELGSSDDSSGCQSANVSGIKARSVRRSPKSKPKPKTTEPNTGYPRNAPETANIWSEHTHPLQDGYEPRGPHDEEPSDWSSTKETSATFKTRNPAQKIASANGPPLTNAPNSL